MATAVATSAAATAFDIIRMSEMLFFTSLFRPSTLCWADSLWHPREVVRRPLDAARRLRFTRRIEREVLWRAICLSVAFPSGSAVQGLSKSRRSYAP